MTAATTNAARAFQGTHTEGRSPEELRELVSHVGAELELAPAEDIIEWAVGHLRRALLHHLVDGRRGARRTSPSKVAPGIDVVFLDTGYHFAETIGTRDAVEAHAAGQPAHASRRCRRVAEQDAEYGKDLYKTDPDLCCALRKVEAAGRRRSPGTTPGRPGCAAPRPTTG